MSVYTLIFVTVLACAANQATAQTIGMYDAPPRSIAEQLRSADYWAVGAQYGLVGGTGLSIHYAMANRFSFELTGGYVTLADGMWSVGVEFQYLLDNTSDSRFYALLGAGVYHLGNRDSNDVVTNQLSHPFRVGLGIGYEYFVSTKAALSLELPMVVFIPSGDSRAEVYPFPQLQFLYYFSLD